MENLGMKVSPEFWKGKSVFLTGHTGFKGSWLAIWLDSLGARVHGYALEPPTNPNMYASIGLESLIDSARGDVRDKTAIRAAMVRARPELVIHMAAQPLVRRSYAEPLETYETNVLGTANLLEAVRSCPSVRAVVVVTTDKCYENKEWPWGYRENEQLGGYDPYSSSKACAEIVAAAYRRSFFGTPGEGEGAKVSLATARAGNVIGGGDWASDRLIPDFIRAMAKGEAIKIRSPWAIRPWQHVLEPLSGYLLLAQALFQKGAEYAEAWNFGPEDSDARTVEWIVRRLCDLWKGGGRFELDDQPQPHEATYLKLDCSKAKSLLDWRPRWGLEHSLERIVEWNLAYSGGEDMREVTLRQILEYDASGVNDNEKAKISSNRIPDGA
jgi:CDP-glucose 4,6-dehydratase